MEHRGAEDPEAVAELVPGTVDTREVEAAIRRLDASSLVREASWTSATADRP